jgi:hypothetical protein
MRWITQWLKGKSHRSLFGFEGNQRPTKTQFHKKLFVDEMESRVMLSAAPLATISTNWSGYAAETSLSSPQNGAVSAVGGTWTVPTATGPSTGYSAVWVGIDGYSSSTVEQLGTEQDFVGGKAQYYAWYEMYPSNSVAISSSKFAVAPGDVITAEVSSSGGSFTLAMNDTPKSGGTVETFSISLSARRASQSSAEWVVEAPSSFNVLPLANFGTVNFSNAYATISGSTGPVDNSSGQAAKINMVASSGFRNSSLVTLDTTSSLSDAATTSTGSLLPPAGTTVSSFSVAYTAPTTPTPTPPPPSRHHWWWATNQPQLMDIPMSAPAVPPMVIAPDPVVPQVLTISMDIHGPVAQAIGPAAVPMYHGQEIVEGPDVNPLDVADPAAPELQRPRIPDIAPPPQNDSGEPMDPLEDATPIIKGAQAVSGPQLRDLEGDVGTPPPLDSLAAAAVMLFLQDFWQFEEIEEKKDRSLVPAQKP